MGEHTENKEALKSPKNSFKNEIFEWLDVVIISTTIVILLFTFVFRVVGVDGSSMEPTLQNQNRVVISHLFYTPKQGDIVVIAEQVEKNTGGSSDTKSKEPIIKRIIATQGQKVEIDYEDNIIYVDGKAFNEPDGIPRMQPRGDVQFPVFVKEGCVFVMGDNRNDSLDSRYTTRIGAGGMIDTNLILGKAIFRIFPFSGIGFIK